MDFLMHDTVSLTLVLSVLLMILAAWVCLHPGWEIEEEKRDVAQGGARR